MVGKGYLLRFRALLSGFGSMHRRILPLGFDATTIEDTQSVGNRDKNSVSYKSVKFALKQLF